MLKDTEIPAFLPLAEKLWEIPIGPDFSNFFKTLSGERSGLLKPFFN